MSTTQQIAKYGNVDDLLFRGKNKAYGAYALRREYDERLKKSMFFFLILCSGIVLSFIIYNQIKPKVDTSTTIYCPTDGETTLIKVEQTKIPKEIPLKNDVKQNALVPSKIVDKADEKVEPL